MLWPSPLTPALEPVTVLPLPSTYLAEGASSAISVAFAAPKAVWRELSRPA
jgi:hypothetical protein